MTLKRNEQGFTIIEVVLVLAIAGLIFLMIFIALPALQRGQRDTGRKNDISTVAAAVNSYKSNNKNNISGLGDTEIRNYLDDLSQYETSAVDVSTNGNGFTAETIRVYLNRKCAPNGQNGSNAVQLVTATRSVAVAGGLENNGSQVVINCQDV